MKKETLKIKKRDKTTIKLELEIPETNKEYENGLAFRDSIPQDTGMMYSYKTNYPYEARMWTPDTRVPMDFIFLDDVGTIIKIHRMAKPLSKEIISCYSTAYVIELGGGECERLNIDIGDVLIFDDKKEKTKFCSPKNIKGNFFIKNDAYFCKTEKGLYQYSYRTHSWLGPIEDDIKWRFFERDQVLEDFADYYVLSEKEAKEGCIKRDFELLDDLKSNSHYYYRHTEDLFIKYDFEHGKFQYYSYINGWSDIKIFNFSRFLDMLRWNSIVQTKNETDELIETRTSDSTKKELREMDRENLFYLNKLKKKIHHYCLVFYKKNEDKTAGWNRAELMGSRTFVEQICEKYKLQKNWKDFMVYGGGGFVSEAEDDWDPVIDFHDIHMTSNNLYNRDTNKWFIFPDEKLPLPERKTSKIKKLEYDLEFNEPDEYDIDEDYDPPYSLSLNLKMRAGKNKTRLYIDYSFMKDKIKQFFKEVKTKKYSQLIIAEYNYAKIFFWKIDSENIRFQIQNWDNCYLKIPIDVIVNKTIFIDFINNLEFELDKKEKEVIKKLNKILKGMKKSDSD